MTFEKCLPSLCLLWLWRLCVCVTTKEDKLLSNRLAKINWLLSAVTDTNTLKKKSLSWILFFSFVRFFSTQQIPLTFNRLYILFVLIVRDLCCVFFFFSSLFVKLLFFLFTCCWWMARVGRVQSMIRRWYCSAAFLTSCILGNRCSTSIRAKDKIVWNGSCPRGRCANVSRLRRQANVSSAQFKWRKRANQSPEVKLSWRRVADVFMKTGRK